MDPFYIYLVAIGIEIGEMKQQSLFQKILVTSYQETDSNKLKRNLKLFWQV